MARLPEPNAALRGVVAGTLITRMAAPLSLTAIYEPVEDGWIQARVEELPEVITAAPTLEEAREMLVDAVREFLQSLLHEPQPTTNGDGARREAVEVTIGV